MKKRSYSWPQGHWDWYRHLAFKHGVRCGRMIFVGGQVDKDSAGAPLNVGDLEAQTAVVVRHIASVLEEFGASVADVTRLVAFYASDGDVDEARFVADVGRHVAALGGAPAGTTGPTIVPVPLPWLALPGMRVEIEAVAMLGEDGRRLPRQGVSPPGLGELPTPFQHGLRVEEHVFVGAQSVGTSAGDAISAIDAVLAALAATPRDLVRVGVWRSPAVVPDLAEQLACLECASVQLPTPRLPPSQRVRMDAWAMCHPNGRPMPRTAHPEAVACGDLVFTSAQLALDANGWIVHAGDLPAQTELSMDRTRAALAAFGIDLDHMVKQTSFYLGAADPKDIVSNQRLRSLRYAEPAGASTGVPLQDFGVPGAMVSIDTIAML